MKYSEPTDFIPKSIRKELGIGEYSKDAKKKKEPAEDKKPNSGKKK